MTRTGPDQAVESGTKLNQLRREAAGLSELEAPGAPMWECPSSMPVHTRSARRVKLQGRLEGSLPSRDRRMTDSGG